MNKYTTIIAASLFGIFAVAIGAFGAHALEPILLKNQRLDTFETAVAYHFYHTFLMLVIGVLQLSHPQSTLLKASAWCCFGGITLFSGSLYFLSLTNITVLGAITPVGGIFFIVAWILLILAAKKML